MGKKKTQAAPPQKVAAAPKEPEETDKLPPKEAGMFKQVVKFYETKQYKKAIKSCEQIQMTCPLHGGTSSTLLANLTSGLIVESPTTHTAPPPCILFLAHHRRNSGYEGTHP